MEHLLKAQEIGDRQNLSPMTTDIDHRTEQIMEDIREDSGKTPRIGLF